MEEKSTPESNNQPIDIRAAIKAGDLAYVTRYYTENPAEINNVHVDVLSGSLSIWHPLKAAIRCSQQEIIQFLLDRGVVTEKLAVNGTSALHSAAATGSEDAIVMLLLARGASYQKDKGGKTPLMVAAQFKRQHIAECFFREATKNPVIRKTLQEDLNAGTNKWFFENQTAEKTLRAWFVQFFDSRCTTYARDADILLDELLIQQLRQIIQACPEKEIYAATKAFLIKRIGECQGNSSKIYGVIATGMEMFPFGAEAKQGLLLLVPKILGSHEAGATPSIFASPAAIFSGPQKQPSVITSVVQSGGEDGSEFVEAEKPAGVVVPANGCT